MPKQFTLDPDQLARRKMYQDVGWPESLTIPDLVIYEMKDRRTLETRYLHRDDAPLVSDDYAPWVPRKDWDAFKSAVARRSRYGGLEGVIYD